MTVVRLDSHIGQPQRFTCLSSDTKPDAATEGGLEAGAELWETDTTKLYVWAGASWVSRDGNIDVSGAKIFITYEHAKVHQGAFYNSGYYKEGVADDGVIELLIQTHASYSAHSYIVLSTSGDAEFTMFENTTFSAAGTPLVPSNNHRDYADAANLTLTHTPTLTLAGDQLDGAEFIAGGKGPQGPGAVAPAGAEQKVLKADTTYLMRLKNIAGNAQTLNIKYGFYEVPAG